jgi:hypothetical protein
MGLGPLHVMAQLSDTAEIPGWRDSRQRTVKNRFEGCASMRFLLDISDWQRPYSNSRIFDHYNRTAFLRLGKLCKIGKQLH